MCFPALPCFALCFDWFILLFLLAVIGQDVTVIGSYERLALKYHEKL